MQTLKRNKKLLILLAIFTIAVLLRVLNLDTADYWRDEAFSIRAAEKPIRRLIEIIAKDTAPPLHTVLLHYWIKIFGDGEFQTRFLSLIFGLSSIIPTYLISKKVFKNYLDSFLVIFLFAINPLLIWYSQETRSYSLLLLLGVSSLYFTINIIENSRPIYFVGLFLTTILGLYTHNLFLFIGLINLILILNNLLHFNQLTKIKENLAKNRKDISEVMFIYLAAGLLYLPWFVILISQWEIVEDQGFWLKFNPVVDIFRVLGTSFTGELSATHFGTNMVMVYIFIWSISILLVLLTLVVRPKNQKLKYIHFWFWSLFFLIWLFSFKTSFFYVRYLIFLIPSAIILLVESLRNIRSHYKLIRNMLLVILIASILLTTFSYHRRAETTKAQMTALVRDIDYNKDDLIIHTNAFTHHAFNIYSNLPNQIYNPDDDLLYYEGLAVIDETDYYRNRSIEHYKRVWVIYLWSPKQHITRELEKNYKLIHKFNYHGQLHMELWENKY